MSHTWIRIALAIALVGLVAGPAAAQDKPIELKFSSWVSAVHGHHTGVMVPWAKMIEEKSKGRLKILGDIQRQLATDSVNVYLYQLPQFAVGKKQLKGLWSSSPIFANDLAALSWQ